MKEKNDTSFLPFVLTVENIPQSGVCSLQFGKGSKQDYHFKKMDDGRIFVAGGKTVMSDTGQLKFKKKMGYFEPKDFVLQFKVH